MIGVRGHSPQNPQNSQKPFSRFVSAGSACSAVIVLSVVVVGCGKKGPPLPPLVRIPQPPAEFTAERRGDDVELQFTVPAANTDNSKPANIERVDVYGFTGPSTVSDADLLKYGGRIGSVDVKAPRDPNEATDPDEEVDAETEPPVGKGLDQGARGRVEEEVSPASLAPVSVPTRERKKPAPSEGPLVGPRIGAQPTRTYVSVGITTRGRKGALSKRVTVPLVPPPPPPQKLEVAYTEKAVNVSWSAPEPAAAGEDLLPSHPLGQPAPSSGYNVYQVPPPDSGKDATEVRLTKSPVGETSYVDQRVTFGETRCYAVRAVETWAGATIESAPTPPVCKKLIDTFPPAAPKGLTAVASQGSISLIWEPNTESDLAGYIVLRGTAPGDTLTPVSPGTITETTFKDDVQAGIRFVYAVQAVDKAGNVSPVSAKVEETAR